LDQVFLIHLMSYAEDHHSFSQPATSGADALLVRAMLARLKAGKDVRYLKVQRVKEAIRDNEYENVLKLHVAAERVVDAMD
jgi:hypothetical protein